MNRDGETSRAAGARLPPGSTLGTFSVERTRKSKYRVTLSAMLGDDKVRVVWRSSMIKSQNGSRGRDTDAERRCIERITTQTRLDLQPRRRTALQSLPPRQNGERAVSPSPGGTVKSVGKPGHGGRRKHNGRPKGRLGKRAVRLRAIALRKRLSDNPGVEYLSSRQLQ
ncbi:unnamed protein product [Choristocarpus tenellus]